jgi:pimeloyl-ACP methyl ester carboxylesterase
MPALRSIDFWPEAALLSYELQRLIAMAPHGGADPGEATWVAARIDPANPESWQAEWAAMAREVEEIAATAGSTRSKRDALLRASNYWRQANFFIPFDDPRNLEYSRNSSRCFREAMPYFDAPAEVVEIPYEGTFLDGYLIHPVGNPSKPWPAVIFGGTWDSSTEEKYFAIGRLLAERGLAVLLFDGPGQGMSLRERDIPSRYDYEVPVAAAIDWITTRPELDEDKVALIGWGAGGYYTFRAAAFEPRVAAGVVWNFDYGPTSGAPEPEPLPYTTIEEWKELASSGKLGNPILARYGLEWTVKRTPGGLEAIAAKDRQHTLEGILHQVTCPVLMLMGEADSVSFHGEGAEELDPIQRATGEISSTDKTLVTFPADGPGSRHINADGMERARAIIADWLVDRIGDPQLAK